MTIAHVESSVPSVSDGVAPKICGADIELGNFISGAGGGYTGATAAQALLDEIRGYARRPHGSFKSKYSYALGDSDDACPGASSPYNPTTYALDGSTAQRVPYIGSDLYWETAQDSGRKFLVNGSCFYIDLGHLELATAETGSAFDHVAAFHAMLRLAREAQQAANTRLPAGQKIHVLVNNNDGQTPRQSYGSHLNFLITQRCFRNIFELRAHHLLFLASYQAASIVLTGAGKVGSDNGQPAVPYQISARSDWYEVLTGVQTTFNRPLCNSRAESLTGSSPWTQSKRSGLARLHAIFWDVGLSHVSTLLKVGMTQIVLAMIEQEQVCPRLLLDDPLTALHHWSHDPSLQAKAMMITGEQYTAVELLEAIFAEAQKFVAAGRAGGLIPRVDEIMALWGDGLDMFRRHDWEALAGRCDWIAKKSFLDRAVQQHNLDWDSPGIRHLDQIYGSLDTSEGLYWSLEKAGRTQCLVSDAAIERFIHKAPEDTRAWLRGYILEHVNADLIHDVDWDKIQFRREEPGRNAWPRYTYPTLRMDHPARFSRQACEAVIAGAPTLAAALQTLGLRDYPRVTTAWSAPTSGLADI